MFFDDVSRSPMGARKEDGQDNVARNVIPFTRQCTYLVTLLSHKGVLKSCHTTRIGFTNTDFNLTIYDKSDLILKQLRGEEM